MVKNFELFLRQENMSDNTIAAYVYAVNDYYSRKKELNKRNLLMYKSYLIETFKPKTVNLLNPSSEQVFGVYEQDEVAA